MVVAAVHGHTGVDDDDETQQWQRKTKTMEVVVVKKGRVQLVGADSKYRWWWF